jgi:hypothetical protein
MNDEPRLRLRGFVIRTFACKVFKLLKLNLFLRCYGGDGDEDYVPSVRRSVIGREFHP